jgi:endoglucanase
VPDLLDEVKYELEWSRRMLIRSGPDAGRVYDRIHESGVEQPEGVSFYDIRRKLVEPTAESSLSFIANMAQAAIVYGRFPQEKEFADACLADAILAWEAMGKAGKPDESQHFTAAALLFEATGREDAHNVVKAGAGKIVQDWPGHINYRGHDIGLAVYSLSKRPEVDKATQKSLRDHYRRWADLAIEAAESRGYREPMMPGVEFTWGSNSIIARSGAHLLIANRVAPSPRYVQGAQDALHWLLGRNPVNQCMISGHGTPPLDAVFHSMYGPIGPGLPLPPGYLAGGVNRFDAPGISAFHAKCWRPDHTCWQITECSIGYQGPFVYLLGALAAPPPAAR